MTAAARCPPPAVMRRDIRGFGIQSVGKAAEARTPGLRSLRSTADSIATHDGVAERQYDVRDGQSRCRNGRSRWDEIRIRALMLGEHRASTHTAISAAHDRSAPSFRRAAVHEAAHAVVGFLRGQWIGGDGLLASDEGIGVAHTRRPAVIPRASVPPPIVWAAPDSPDTPDCYTATACSSSNRTGLR